MIRIKPFQDWDIEWVDQAACVGMRGVFYPTLNARFEDEWTDENLALAKSTCAGCPIRDRCLDYAVVGREDEGIWGEKLPEERRKLRLSWAKDFSSLMRSIDKEVSYVADTYVMAGELLT